MVATELDYDGESPLPTATTSHSDISTVTGDIAENISSSTTADYAENIWDDNVLIKAWNRSIKEYRKYHGKNTITAETLEQEMQQPLPKWETVSKSKDNDEDSIIHGIHSALEEKRKELSKPTTARYHPYHTTNTNNIRNSNQVKEDEVIMENMLWSWYNAGYYKGLYDAMNNTYE